MLLCFVFRSENDRFYFSISGSSATIYAYLGEFHNERHRSRAIMLASVIFGITTVTMPLLAWLVINRTWSLYLPLLNINFKPWRLFIVVCGLPSLVSGIGLWPMPESPKYVHSAHRRQDEAIAILQTVHRHNCPGTSLLPAFTIIAEENELQKAVVVVLTEKRSAFIAFIHSMWTQTAPLFRRRLFRVTALASLLQFGLFTSSSGVYMWLPEVVNRMTEFIQQNPTGTKQLLCDIMAATRPPTSMQKQNESDVSEKGT